MRTAKARAVFRRVIILTQPPTHVKPSDAYYRLEYLHGIPSVGIPGPRERVLVDDIVNQEEVDYIMNHGFVDVTLRTSKE